MLFVLHPLGLGPPACASIVLSYLVYAWSDEPQAGVETLFPQSAYDDALFSAIKSDRIVRNAFEWERSARDIAINCRSCLEMKAAKLSNKPMLNGGPARAPSPQALPPHPVLVPSRW